MVITENMIRIRARQLAEKYEGDGGRWQKYWPLAIEQLRAELGDK